MPSDIMETAADKLYELVLKEKIIKASVAALKLGFGTEEVINLGEILEEDNLIKLHYPPVGEPFLLKISKVKKKTEIVDKEKEKTHVKRSKAGMIKFVAISASMIFLIIAFAYKNNPNLFNSFENISISAGSYLDMNTILIIATVFTVLIILILIMSLKLKKRKLAKKKVEKNANKEEKPKKKARKKGYKTKEKSKWWKGLFAKIKTNKTQKKHKTHTRKKGK